MSMVDVKLLYYKECVVVRIREILLYNEFLVNSTVKHTHYLYPQGSEQSKGLGRRGGRIWRDIKY